MMERCENSIIDEELLGMKKDDMEVVDLNRCEVVRRQYLAHTRDNVLTIRPDGIQFNATCISRMPGVEYIYVLIDRENRRLLITPCSRDDKDGQKWCNVTNGVRKSRKINGKPFGDLLYKTLGWCKGYAFKICGCPAISKDDDDRLLMVFDFNEAEKIPLTAKQRSNAGVGPEDMTEEELLELDIIEEERAKAKEEGRKSKYRTLGVSYSDTWENGSFGEKAENHENRPDIPTWTELKPEATIEQSSETASAPEVQPTVTNPEPSYLQNTLYNYGGVSYGQGRSAFSV